MPTTNIIEQPWIKHPKAWWLPVVTLSVTLFGIIGLGWSLYPVVIVFWWEVIMMVFVALVRMLFSLDSQPFVHHLWLKFMLLIGGVLLGGLFIMFSVVFTFSAFGDNQSMDGMSTIPHQIRAVQLSYLVGLVLHFFANGRYKTANPASELMVTFMHLLILIALLMVVTQHLIPRFPHLNQAMWVGVAVVTLKFLIDLLFSGFGSVVKGMFREVEQ
jgi:Family of unknown function (DUF6498)